MRIDIDIDTLGKEIISIDGKPISEIKYYRYGDNLPWSRLEFEDFLVLALHLAGVDMYFDGASLMELSGLELTEMIKPESGE